MTAALNPTSTYELSSGFKIPVVGFGVMLHEHLVVITY